MDLLFTYIYGAVRNGFEGHWKGGLWKSRLFWALKWQRAKRVPFWPKKVWAVPATESLQNLSLRTLMYVSVWTRSTVARLAPLIWRLMVIPTSLSSQSASFITTTISTYDTSRLWIMISRWCFRTIADAAFRGKLLLMILYFRNRLAQSVAAWG